MGSKDVCALGEKIYLLASAVFDRVRLAKQLYRGTQMCQALNHQLDFEADDYDKVGADDDDGVYHPETGALEQTMARSEGGRDNEVMLISVQTFNFVI